jgi:hypothetical protein
MLYYVDRYSYDIIPNPHVKVVGNKTTFVTHQLARHSNTFKSKQKKELFPKPEIDPENRPFHLDQYKCITLIQRDVVIK